jgi:spore coat protein U-like protein
MKMYSRMAVTLLSGLIAVNTYAADETEVKVTAAVAENCKITSAEDINFGLLDPAQATDVKADGSVEFACTMGVDYSVSTNEGANFDASTKSRQMKGADSNFLPYALEQDSFTGKGKGFSNPISVSLAASLAGADYKDLPADDYRDTLVVSINP